MSGGTSACASPMTETLGGGSARRMLLGERGSAESQGEGKRERSDAHGANSCDLSRRKSSAAASRS